MHASPFTNSDGSPLVLEQGIDVTDRKRAEERLKNLKDCFLGFGADPFENINRLTAVVGELLGATCALYNRLEGDLLCSWGRWNAPPDFNPVDRAEGHICHDVIRQASRDVLVVRNLQESPYAQTDPNVVPYNLQTYIGQAVEFGGKCVGSLCVVFQRDHVPCEGDKELMRAIAKAISVEEERRRATEALRESEDRYRRLVEFAPEMIFTQCEGNFVYVNPTGLGLLGATKPEDVIGKPVLDFIHSDYREIVRERIQNILGGREAVLIEEKYLRVDGTSVDVEVAEISGVYQGKPAAQMFVRDITERRKLEDQLRQSQKMEAVGRLAGGIAHDFNNLMTVVTGYCELLLPKHSSASPERQAIEEIRKAGNRAALLTRQLLAFSRKQMLQPKVISLSGIVSEIEKMFQRLIGEHIALHTATEADLWKVAADPSQVEQVIMNLAINARDAMPGGGSLSLSTANVWLEESPVAGLEGAKAGPYVMLTIRDTGCGMDEKTISRIYEPFFTTKNVGEGTGLGLSMTYGIVKQSGGHITVESAVGKGTTFRVYFPRTVEEPAEDHLAGASFDRLTGTETVLVVEDEQAVRNLVVGVLAAEEYRVLSACDGDEGIRLCEEHKGPIDLIVTDVVMPRMGGRELAARLEAVKPGMKVLFISGYTENTGIQRGDSAPGFSFLQKPFKPKDLLLKVREVLDTLTDRQTVGG